MCASGSTTKTSFRWGILAWDRHAETPEWVYGSERFLSEPWFAASDTPGLRPLLLLESPVMFRRRNLFVSINALDRARR